MSPRAKSRMGTRSGDGVLARQQHRAWQSVCAVRARRAGSGDRCSGGAPSVAMMQATDFRDRDDGSSIAGRRDGTRNRRVFVQR
jgi:hypothetical protein